MNDEKSAAPGWYPDGSGGQRYWDGTKWTDIAPPASAPPKKKHTVRNVMLIVIALLVLFIGGCMALIGGALKSIDDDIKDHENQEGGVNNPITVKVGEAFTIGDAAYSKGWTIKKDALDFADVEGLKVTNKGDDEDWPSIEIRLWKGSESLADISCGLLEDVPAGATQALDCSGDDPLPSGYDKVTVANSR